MERVQVAVVISLMQFSLERDVLRTSTEVPEIFRLEVL